MKTLYLLICSLGLLAACTEPATSAGPWDGEYFYASSGGHTAGGSNIFMKITVSINSPKLKQACVFQAMGFQTDDYFICSIAIKDQTLEVKFKSDRDGYAEKIYKVGEVLLSLRLPKDQKNQYAVSWGSYVPFDDMSQANKYFEKSK